MPELLKDEIVSIEPVSIISRRYDITVQDNHNFFANDILVHNCQNIWKEIDSRRDDIYEVTLKLDGSSCTIFKYEGELRVCSRNLELKINEENTNNTLVRMALEVDKRLGDLDNIAFQGEIMGPGLNGNREGFKETRFFVYDVVDLKTRLKMNADDRARVITRVGLDHVPIVGTYREFPYTNLPEALRDVETYKSINHPIAEGLVFKSLDDPEFSFKIISNKYLTRCDT